MQTRLFSSKLHAQRTHAHRNQFLHSRIVCDVFQGRWNPFSAGEHIAANGCKRVIELLDTLDHQFYDLGGDAHALGLRGCCDKLVHKDAAPEGSKINTRHPKQGMSECGALQHVSAEDPSIQAVTIRRKHLLSNLLRDERRCDALLSMRGVLTHLLEGKKGVGEGGVHTKLQELPDCCIKIASETFEARKKTDLGKPASAGILGKGLHP